MSLVTATGTSLASVCTVEYVQSVLPSADILELAIDSSSVTANPVYNASFSSSDFYPASSFDYCNVTLAYSHSGLDDRVQLEIWLPAPSKFKNRWLSTGGGGMAINPGASGLAAGVQYGAVTGMTDGGFGSFSAEATDVMLSGNGTINYDMLYAFGYTAHHEMTTIGKAFAKNFFSMTNDKLYAYYFACSEGGREGYSQVQRFADDWDGAVIGAPALRYGQQQANHIYANVVEKTMDYYPPPCELEKIVNLTITACDALDGKTDNLVSRTDLCKLHYDISHAVGQSYSCAASGMTPAQEGKVTSKGVAVAKKILDGLVTLDGRRAYLYYQPTASFDDAATTYDSSTKEWGLSLSGLSTSWITMFLELQEVDTLTSLDNVTYDTVRDWMEEGMQRYYDVLQTTWPDLSPFQSAGGKIIHIHGESDPSIPSASSVRYHESVRQIMYPSLSFDKSHEAMNDWNRLYLVPGGAHCSPSSNQDGPWPQNSIQTLIDWVEKDDKPGKLEATFLSGDKEGETQELCAWPQRPLWTNGGKNMECVFDQKSYDSWVYDFDAYNMPVY